MAPKQRVVSSIIDRPTCLLCSQEFSHKSSLVRHARQCCQKLKQGSRQKSCWRCSKLKLRCDLQWPSCARCVSRSSACEYASNDGTRLPPKPVVEESLSWSQVRVDIEADVAELGSGTKAAAITSQQWRRPMMAITDARRQELLGTTSGAPISDAAVKHTVHFVVRVLNSWPRMMASRQAGQLPPIIHRAQYTEIVPTALSNCSVLARMWLEHDGGSSDLVQHTVLQEVRRLLYNYSSYKELDLLAAVQSLLILLILLFFGTFETPVLHSTKEAELLIELWGVKEKLAGTGLLLDEECDHKTPSWNQWAIVSAKRRSILALNHLEWSWSLLRGYPTLTCFELGPLPAPAPEYLWRAKDEATWSSLYSEWLWIWKEGSYKMMELFNIEPGGKLDPRSEMWLAEADQYGIMLMAEVNSTGS